MNVKIPVPKPLKILSKNLSSSIYLVGGYVRDYILYGKISSDVDFCAPILVEEIEKIAKSLGFIILATYKKTGTLKLRYGNQAFEYTSFRTEEYSSGGVHTPNTVTFTTDIRKDAKRRDFKCNAVYYDVKNDKIVDVLGGAVDIKNKVLSTVVAPEKVFVHDGLRLMRLARFSAFLSLEVPKRVLAVARKYKNLILDVTPDRIKEELLKILNGNEEIAYNGLSVLEKIGVLDLLFSRNSAKYCKANLFDAVCALKPELRFFALCFLRSANLESAIEKLEFYKIAKTKVKAIRSALVLLYAFFGSALKTSRIKRLILDNFIGFNDFLTMATAVTGVIKAKKMLNARLQTWQKIKREIELKKLPIGYNDLELSAKELIELGVEPRKIKSALGYLLFACQKNPKLSRKKKLIAILRKKGLV